jgi:hypothetical protein
MATKSVIITDQALGTLRLTRTRLIELTGGTSFFLKLKDFAKAYKKRAYGTFGVSIFEKGTRGSKASSVPISVTLPGYFALTSGIGRIGCRQLSKVDFNKVLTAAKALVRKPRTVVKARAAAAGKAKRKK